MHVAQKYIPVNPPDELDAFGLTPWNPVLPIRIDADAAAIGTLFIKFDSERMETVESQMRGNAGWLCFYVQAQMLHSEPLKDRIRVHGSWVFKDGISVSW